MPARRAACRAQPVPPASRGLMVVACAVSSSTAVGDRRTRDLAVSRCSPDGTETKQSFLTVPTSGGQAPWASAFGGLSPADHTGLGKFERLLPEEAAPWRPGCGRW